MLVHIENTPNPNSIKFIPEGLVAKDITIDIDTTIKAKVSPLAQDLFKIEGVKRVFLGNDFISVTIEDEKAWDYTKPQIIACISDYYNNKLEIIDYNELSKQTSDDEVIYDEDSIEGQIQMLLDERIRPAVAMDGGDIVYKGFKDGKVYLQLQGSCSGCPSSKVTLKNGIENMLKYFIPEIEEVVEVDGN
ncbi:NifU family protein [Rickettsiales bacterium LUAb2]